MSDEIPSLPKTGRPKAVKLLRDSVGQGIGEGLTGAMFSLVLSALIVTGLFFDVGLFKAIERAGIDLSFSILSRYNVPTGLADTQPATAKSVAYQFIDMDKIACEAFAPVINPTNPNSAKTYCETRNPIPHAFMSALIRSPDQNNLRVLILDRAINLNTAEDSAFIKETIAYSRANPDGPWILVPLEVRPFDPDLSSVGDPKALQAARALAPAYRAVNEEWFDPHWLAEFGFFDSKVRFALFSVGTDDEAGDNLVRTYEPVLKVRSGSQDYDVPSAAYLAAQLYDKPTPRDAGIIDSAFYRYDCAKSPYCANWRIKQPGANAVASRIIYSLPSLSLLGHDVTLPHDASGEAVNSRFASIYSRKPASDLYNPQTGRLGYVFFEGHERVIAILGSSLNTAMDLHDTPIGVMSGSELMLNVIRSQIEFRTPDRALRTTVQNDGLLKLQSYWAMFAEKAQSALLPAVIMICAYSLANILRLFGQTYVPFWRNHVWPRLILPTAIVVAALALCLQLEFQSSLESLYKGLDQGRVVDTLTPIAAMGIELYTDLAQKLLLTIKLGLRRGRGWLRSVGRVSRIKPR